MTNTNQRLLVFVEPYRLYVYATQMDQPAPIDLPTSAVRDLEVLNRDQIYTLVETFLTTNGITGGSAIIVLSQSMLFEKQIVQDLSDEGRRNAAIKEYIDNVPFEQTAYVSYPIETGIGVIATNEEFFVTIKKAFDRKNIMINLIVPIRAFGDIQISPQTGPDPQVAAYLLQNADQAKQFAFHSKLLTAAPTKVELARKKADYKKANKKLPIYLSVFGFLLLVLVMVIVISRQPPPAKPIATNANAEAPAAAIEPPPAVPESTGSAELDRATLRVQIKTPPLFRTRIDGIKARLTAAGYGKVDVLETAAGENTVLFLDKSKLNGPQRAALAVEMKAYFNQFSVQEVEQAEYAIQLVVGKEL